MFRVQSYPRVLTLLLCTAGYSSAAFLYVASYSGTVTTLNLTLPADEEIAVLEAVSSTDGCAGSPSWLTLDYANRVLYCTDEGLNSGVEGSLSAFSTKEDGSLELLDKVSTVLGPVSAVVYGDNSRGLAVAHYAGSAFTTWDVSDPSALTSVQTDTYTLPEPGPNPDRQDAPHPHEAVLDPTGNFVLVPDLGADLVRVYAVPSGDDLSLTAVDPIVVAAGSGPRHIAFAVYGDTTYLYLTTELANTIVGYNVTYGESSISFEELWTIGTHGEGTSAPEGAAAAEIVVTPDAKFLIVSSRMEDSLEIPNFETTNSTSIVSDPLISFTIDCKTGGLDFLQEFPAGGRVPRQFSINKDGTLVAVGLQADGRAVVIERDPETGDLGRFVAYANVEGEITAVIFDE